jgi:hypothetical protein
VIKSDLVEGESIIVGRWEIILVQSTVCAAASSEGRISGTALREPVAVVVRSPDGDRAFDITGREIPIGREARS